MEKNDFFDFIIDNDKQCSASNNCWSQTTSYFNENKL